MWALSGKDSPLTRTARAVSASPFGRGGVYLHSACKIPATASMRLRAYLGSPALIEVPVERGANVALHRRLTEVAVGSLAEVLA